MTGGTQPAPEADFGPSHGAGTGAEGLDPLSLDDLYEHAPIGYLSLLADGTVVRVNETFLSWTGRTREQLLDGTTRFASLLSVGGQIFYESHCAPMLLAGQPVEQISLDVKRVDGSLLPVLFAATGRGEGADGTPTILRVTLVDISHRRLLERDLVARNEQLALANEQYDTFAHAVAHDLRAPLRGIRTNTEFFLEDTADVQFPAGTEQLLETVVRLTDRMQAMLDDLLAYAHAGTDAWHPQPVSLQEVVGEVIDLLGPRAGGAAISPSNRSFTADPGALRQLLLNLVANAVKYSDGPAQVTIDVCTLDDAAARSSVPPTLQHVAGDAAVLTVADRGIGIDDAHHDQIFGLFRQLDPNADGLGAGLALCRLICRRRGGDIWVSSTPGEGSTFFVVIDP